MHVFPQGCPIDTQPFGVAALLIKAHYSLVNCFVHMYTEPLNKGHIGTRPCCPLLKRLFSQRYHYRHNFLATALDAATQPR